MSSLKAFLNPIKVENKEVVISDRFKEDGKPVPFVIRPVTQEENEEILRKYRRKDKKSGEETFDQIGYNHELVATAVVSPDLNDSELQSAYGVLGSAKLLKKMLLIGEFTKLGEEVQNLSGLDKDLDNDIEEVKN